MVNVIQNKMMIEVIVQKMLQLSKSINNELELSQKDTTTESQQLCIEKFLRQNRRQERFPS